MSLEYALRPEFTIEEERRALESIIFGDFDGDEILAPVSWVQMESPVGNVELVRASRLTIDNEATPLVVEQKPGWSLEAPGFEVFVGDRKIFLGTVEGAMDAAMTYVEENLEVDELIGV